MHLRTAATVVHLLEPVINQGYELQGESNFHHRSRVNSYLTFLPMLAIGRVDRGIGQTRPTTVFCYSTES